jgi:hypothetical protein
MEQFVLPHKSISRRSGGSKVKKIIARDEEEMKEKEKKTK